MFEQKTSATQSNENNSLTYRFIRIPRDDRKIQHFRQISSFHASLNIKPRFLPNVIKRRTAIAHMHVCNLSPELSPYLSFFTISEMCLKTNNAFCLNMLHSCRFLLKQLLEYQSMPREPLPPPVHHFVPPPPPEIMVHPPSEVPLPVPPPSKSKPVKARVKKVTPPTKSKKEGESTTVGKGSTEETKSSEGK